MEADFWHSKWSRRDIGFHTGDANPLLVRYWGCLQQAGSQRQGSRVLLPLCGKTRDIAWLLAQGVHVVGVELVETAVQELFDELGIRADVQQSGAHKCYSAQLPSQQTGAQLGKQTDSVKLEVLVGDFFALTPQQVQQGGSVDAVYDRAAMVALPPAMREQYAQQLMRLSGHAPQLLITYDYDQRVMAGPPFAVAGEEVAQHYAAQYTVQVLETAAVGGRLKEKAGGAQVQETLWLLQRRSV